MDAAETLCPHVMKRSNLRAELVKASSAKMVVPKSFVTKTLLEQSGVDIINKIRCVCVCLSVFVGRILLCTDVKDTEVFFCCMTVTLPLCLLVR